MKRPAFLCLAWLLLAAVGNVFPDHAAADTFGSGANTFDIEFVSIGNPGNAADTDDGSNANPGIQNFGSVAQAFRMGKFEISEQMIDKANAEGGLGITKDSRGPDKPATSTSWNEAARFVNWLNTNSGSTPAYKFTAQPGGVGYGANSMIELWTPGDAGYDPNNHYRNRLARYFLPSVDEWYKAAYYDPSASVYYDYPTGSNGIPDGIDSAGDPIFDTVFNDGFNQGGPNNITNVGLLSPYGTAGQGGNVSELLETSINLVNSSSSDSRGGRGGGWSIIFSSALSSSSHGSVSPESESIFFGFRVASNIPEPSTLLLAISAFATLLTVRRTPTTHRATASRRDAGH